MPTRLLPRWFNQPKYLRQIFNSVWLQLLRDGKADPKAMRKQVASVWAFGKPDVLDPDNIKHAVLRSFIRRSHKKQAGD
jgi:hypothetical protein